MPNVMVALPNLGGNRGALCSSPKVGVPSSNAAKTPNPLELAGVLQTIPHRSQPLVGQVHHI